MRRTGLALVLVAGCAAPDGGDGIEGAPFSAGPYGPDGPPEIGWVRDSFPPPMDWRVYDYSLGAIDPSAFVQREGEGYRVTVIGYPEGEPFTEIGLIRITADVADLDTRGRVPVTVARLLGDSREGPRLEGSGETSHIRLTLPPEGEVLGEVAMNIDIDLCPAGGADGDCKFAAIDLDTRAAFDGF